MASAMQHLYWNQRN